MNNENRRLACGISLVWPGLWVGSAKSITTEFLNSHDVAVLVWATPEVSPPPTLSDSIRFIPVLVKDEESTDMSPYFPVVTSAFKRCQGKGMVVVCRAGVSRSATLALAALIGNTDMPHMNLKYAYEMVKVARPFIRPNSGFLSQLILYEEKVRGVSTVKMVQNPYDSSEKVPDIYLGEINNSITAPFNMFVPL